MWVCEALDLKLISFNLRAFKCIISLSKKVNLSSKTFTQIVVL